MKRLFTGIAFTSTLALLPIAGIMAVTSPSTVKTAAVTTSTPSGVTSNLPTPTPVVGKLTPAEEATHLNNLKTRGAAEITRRVAALTAAHTSLNATSKLTAADKATLSTQLQAEIDALGTLNTKLSAETTLAAARTDVQSIFDGYRVYALMLPKIRLVTAADQAAVVGEAFNTLAHTLSAKIAAAKSSGKDVTAEQASLSDLDAKIGDARLKYLDLGSKIIALAPADYNANRNVLAADRDTLTTVRADFKAARADASSILSALGVKTSPTPSASPTAVK